MTFPTVTILMATFEGERFLPVQLASFRALTGCDWSLWASDDGSRDRTPDLIAGFLADCGREGRLLDGPRAGASANFFSLLRHPDLPDGAVALADQDDVWVPDKLERALGWLAAAGDRPALYCARTLEGSPGAGRLRPSAGRPRQPSLRNALVQSLGGGNTMVLNAPALRALRRTACLPPHHDWWLYQFVTAIGGRVFWDPRPALIYRQHGANVFGSGRGLGARLGRAAMIADARYAGWIGRNLDCLESCAAQLTPTAAGVISGIRDLRRKRGTRALAAFRALGLHRQTRAGTAALALAAMAGRL